MFSDAPPATEFADFADLTLELLCGERVPAVRFVLNARSKFFRDLFSSVPLKRDADGRCIVRASFPFDAAAVRETIEWLHAPAVPAVPLDKFRRLQEVCDFLDVPIETHLPAGASYADKLAFVPIVARSAASDLATIARAVSPTYGVLATDDELTDYLVFLEDLQAVLHSLAPRVVATILDATRRELWSVMRHTDSWRVAVSDPRAARYFVMCDAFPPALVQCMSVQHRGTVYEGVSEPSDPVDAIAVALVTKRQEVGGLALSTVTGGYRTTYMALDARRPGLVRAQGSELHLDVKVAAGTGVTTVRVRDGVRGRRHMVPNTVVYASWDRYVYSVDNIPTFDEIPAGAFFMAISYAENSVWF